MTADELIDIRSLYDRIGNYITNDTIATEAGGLLARARDKIASFASEHDKLAADRDAAWRMANAAAEAHDTLRTRYLQLDKLLGIAKDDSADDIAQRLTVYVDRQTKAFADAIAASERELSVARARAGTLGERCVDQDARIEQYRAEFEKTINELNQATMAATELQRWRSWAATWAMYPESPTDESRARADNSLRQAIAETMSAWHTHIKGLDAELATHAATIEHLERERGELMEALGARADDQHRRELADLRQLAVANAEVLQQQGAALANLQVVLALAGAPKQGDLRAWASDIRNTILGQRREIEEVVRALRDKKSARQHELAEIQAAADALPPELKPANGYPYSIMATTPIQVFMLLRERALALMNREAAPPVSGA